MLAVIVPFLGEVVIDPNWIIVILSVVSGFLGMPVINWIKGLLKWDDKKAVALATVVSLVLALVVSIVNGEIVGELTLENVSIAFGLVYSVANLFFKAITTKGNPPFQPH